MPLFGIENPMRPERWSFMHVSSKTRVRTIVRYACRSSASLLPGSCPLTPPSGSMTVRRGVAVMAAWRGQSTPTRDPTERTAASRLPLALPTPHGLGALRFPASPPRGAVARAPLDPGVAMRHASRSGRAWSLAAFGSLAIGPLTACGSGGLSDPVHVRFESEPNNTPVSADPLDTGQPGIGSLNGASEVDYWKVFLPGASTVTIELFATRMDQGDWDLQDCVPRLTLYDVDGTSKLLEHDFSGAFSAGWGWGKHDLDIPR